MLARTRRCVSALLCMAVLTTISLRAGAAARDNDGDGVADTQDNCVDCYNPSQRDADGDGLGDCWRCDWCDGPGTDSDWDGLCDGVDNCPYDWNLSQADQDGDGIGNACDAGDPGPPCSDGDGDGDGVCDTVDNCRGCYNPGQADADGDGLGDCWRCDWCDGPGTDTDWDGFCDGVDNCPDDWNQSQADHDRDGLGDACDRTVNPPPPCVDVDADGICDDVDPCIGEACPPPCRDLDVDGICDDVDPCVGECPPPGGFTVEYTPDAPGVNGFTAVDRVAWHDARGLRREADFAKSYPDSIFPQIMGYATRLVWQPTALSDPIVCDENLLGINAANAQGWGINVMHIDWTQSGGINPYTGDNHPATTTKRDGYDFVQEPVFLGKHHLIFRTAYKQYTTLIIGGVDDRKSVDVTADWLFFDGVDDIVYALTIDATREYVADGEPFRNDVRTPYCEFDTQSWRDTWDWSGVSGDNDGQSWGDFKTFISRDMAHWTYGGSNTVPFVWEWVSPAGGRGDAEAVFVQTETYDQKQAGGGAFNDGQDGAGETLPVYGDVAGDPYAYQLNYYQSYGGKRMTWGMPYGAMDGGQGSTPGYQNYSVIMHIGRYSDHGAAQLLQETESVHDGTLRVRALTGALRTVGPEGSGNPTPHTYSPAGYNHVYRTWEIVADGDQVELTFDLAAGTYRNPVIVVHGFDGASADAAQVRLDGVVLPQEQGCYLSHDPDGGRLFVTVLAELESSNLISIAW